MSPPIKRQNLPTYFQESNLRESNVDGFIVDDIDKFKPETVFKLYEVLMTGNFDLYSAKRGNAPMTDDDIPKLAAKAAQHQQFNVNIGTNYGVVTGQSDEVKDIHIHIESIRNSNQEAAEILKNLTDAVEVSVLDPEKKQEAFERISDLTAEIDKPKQELKGWQITEKIQNLGTFLAAGGTLYEGYEKIKPLIDQLPKLLGGG